MELAPQSAIAVTLYRQRRSVSMARGEVRFDVAPDPDRPFEVITREARIEVVGTVFTVRDRGGPVTVGVEHGHVRVRVLGRDAQDATGPAAATLDLLPGQIVDIRNGQAEPVRQADAATLSAWREGWLVFENTPLAEALATVNAYRTQPIEAADARVAALRLTGRFRANDSAGLLAVLPSILPLRVRPQAGGGVQLQAL